MREGHGKGKVEVDTGVGGFGLHSSRCCRVTDPGLISPPIVCRGHVLSIEGLGVSYKKDYLPATASKAFGLVLAMASRVRAAPLGCLRPCSQPCNVRTETPMRTANWD